MQDEIYASIELIDLGHGDYTEEYHWNTSPFSGSEEYIRKDIHEEKMEVLRRIISGLEADIRKMKGK